ncbi:metabolite traffic protein EboE [Rhodocytophaga aerolata]|uniref:Metabolite traffic protein EboE n=1 Tax=Rhodocytophaga aerolata TaxID=455078 RepID=A0ABT8R0K3_9BACT|nr:metabolite traffic protein EboE [Rhodocytophaga aerolata]MDO1445620.1 metabolite traffic protein EboE [Rhodocytophaga aerolata]
MQFGQSTHLTYCTNIHPGETWEDVFHTLKMFLLPLKSRLSPSKPMGVGLRLSDQASRTLVEDNNLALFKQWLDTHELYVFTMNGFPYGGFHRQVVKDAVYAPDWRTEERVAYTIRLCHILAYLLPEGMEGGISTVPVSYKPWFKSENARKEAFEKGAMHLTRVVEELTAIGIATGKFIHIDIEPEPDCLLENTAEMVNFYTHSLLPIGSGYLMQKLGIKSTKAEDIIRRHIQVCYDVCHFAVEYESPAYVFNEFAKAGIKIGKIQISAALKAMLPVEAERRKKIAQRFESLAESTYLHQVVARKGDGTFVQFPDLPQALAHINDYEMAEWRTHFHVPVFVSDFQDLQSTQEDIVEVLRLNNQQPVTSHLEVETYTWEVLPKAIKVDLLSSIGREMEWVIAQMGSTK